MSQKAVEDGTFWSAKASDYLRGYLHAAALARYDLRAVAAWVSGADPDAPERILAAAGAHQWALTLAELRSEAHKTAATVRMVMSRALAFMADPALAASVLPGPRGGFDITAFLADRGTVYLIAEAVSEEAPVAPLFAAMAAEIHHVAAQIGQASAARLDPPLLMGLDEVTQICPVPLPFWLADSGGKGIQVAAVVHGEAQLAGRWGDHGRQIVLDTSSVKVFLPGITDTTLQTASTLCGQASWKLRGQHHVTRHDVATPDMIRQLPAGFALVIRGGCAPVIARLPRAWKNRAYRRAKAPKLSRHPYRRKIATLLATVRWLEVTAADDALELFDVFMSSELIGRAGKAADKERLRRQSGYARHAGVLTAVEVLFEAAEWDENVSLEAVWEAIDNAVGSRARLREAVEGVQEFIPPPGADPDGQWRAMVVERYATVRGFVKMLCRVIEFEATADAQKVLTAMRDLPGLLDARPTGRVPKDYLDARRVNVDPVPAGWWQRLVFPRDRPEGTVDRNAYVFCVLELFHTGLRHRDIFATVSDRWSDPRARLLAGSR